MTVRVLLCSDLDRTLLPNGPQPESAGARERLADFAARKEVTLVYVTGRHRALVEQAISEYRLPVPDYVIGDVGTTIYAPGPSGWRRWEHWEEEIAPDWRGHSHADLAALLVDLPEITLQEREKQNTHKLSYYVPLTVNHAVLLQQVHRRLQARGISASVVWSVDEPAGTGLLDVLPARANKLHAIEFLMQQHGFTPAETVFAGDSGNDLPVLSSALQAVLVANASEEVRAAALSQAAAHGHEDALYIARGGLLGMNGNYSAGVLEGVLHYIPQAGAWLGQETERDAK